MILLAVEFVKITLLSQNSLVESTFQSIENKIDIFNIY